MTTPIRQVLRPVLPPHISVSSTPVHRASPAPPRGIPFFRDPAHTIPTKWNLYRPLLRILSSSSTFSSIHREIKIRWRETKGLTSVPRVKLFLNDYYELLEYLKSDKPKHKEEINKLEIRLKEKHSKIDLKEIEKMKIIRNVKEEKPKMTGSYHRPTLFNIPLPRFKPQPISIGSTIHNRLRSREKRMLKRKEYKSLLIDMKLEIGFWKSLQTTSTSSNEISNSIDLDWIKSKDPRFPGGWDGLIKEEIKIMDQRFIKENLRSEMKFDDALLDRIQRAKEKKTKWWKGIKESKKDDQSVSIAG
ncbi:uncharacterized protein I206_100450 [Kwoniella pini CBS 10737]|uniref:Uncharacterized protein n=1 Tax=Kwoniella pini CBS 10737 TaxID=1296096 RepID=A0A1B9IDS5_9TREE|nr:uncharacterized protein I206_00879 [Kwoniella pini CBS 10737]OCF53574.1 hypothetical protein I206_00879 [Kwoniella pini CBS 10737]